MKTESIKDIKQHQETKQLSGVRGHVKAVYDYKQGEGKKGPWSLQPILISDGTDEIRVIFSGREEISKDQMMNKELYAQAYISKKEGNMSGVQLRIDEYKGNIKKEIFIADYAQISFGDEENGTADIIEPERKIVKEGMIKQSADEFEEFNKSEDAVDAVKQMMLPAANMMLLCLDASTYVKNQYEAKHNTEMTDDQMRDRLVGMLTKIEPILISTGQIRHEAIEYNKFVDKEKEMLDIQRKVGKYLIHKEAEYMSTEEMKSYVKYIYNKYVGQGNPCLIIHDYLKISDEKTSSHNQEYQIIRNKTNELKRLASDLKCPVLTAMQTNRRPDDDTLSLKDALKVDSTAMAMSHSASWVTSFLAFYKAKDQRERELDGPEFGTHKLVPLKIRSWGLGGMQYEAPLRRETPDGVFYQKNQINLERGVFTLEARGTLRTIINRFDIQGNDASEEFEEDESNNAEIVEHELESDDDGTL